MALINSAVRRLVITAGWLRRPHLATGDGGGGSVIGSTIARRRRRRHRGEELGLNCVRGCEKCKLSFRAWHEGGGIKQRRVGNGQKSTSGDTAWRVKTAATAALKNALGGRLRAGDNQPAGVVTTAAPRQCLARELGGCRCYRLPSYLLWVRVRLSRLR